MYRRAFSLDVFPDLDRLHRTRPERYPGLLESTAHATTQGRYDILFAFPRTRLHLRADGRLFRDNECLGTGDFLALLDREWRAVAGAADVPAELPFTGGWLLYLGYELAGQIEPSLTQTAAHSDWPTAVALRCPAAVIRDHLTHRTWLIAETGEAALLDAMHADLTAIAEPATALVSASATVHEEDPARFLSGVARALEYIRAGDVFQVNLSRAWQVELARPVVAADLHARLRRANPAPFAGSLHLDAGRAVVSSSPERLLELRWTPGGRVVRTRPIAGTYPRHVDPAQDRAWAQELLQHPKERAEHVMLIDLERNDLGRVCVPGTVRVNELMQLESYRHVHHIVSEVSGRLRAEVTPGEAIRAVFPGGTITGCPKVRCMQIIRELERAPRGAYTGAFGYLNRDGSLDLNILIRTLLLDGRRVTLRAGAGIVADSVPERELAETRAKARGLLVALGVA